MTMVGDLIQKYFGMFFEFSTIGSYIILVRLGYVQKIWELESPAKSPSVRQPPVRRHHGKSITNSNK
jgi:hypothetical protein